jgi:steroid delta-isomerase-like uncharacterized protein
MWKGAGVPAPQEIVEQLNRTLNEHDIAAGRALYAADAHLVMASGHQLDLDGLDRLTQMTIKAFPDMHIDVRRCLVDGDVVITEEVLEGTHEGPFAGLAPTGKKVSLPIVHVTVVRDDRIVSRVAYHDTAGILRQLQA